MEKYGVFEEVEDEGQETVDPRWVVTRKEKSDGQKQKVKARLVAKGFQEAESPQSHSPTMLRESMKLFFSVAANEDFQLRKIDIRAAFLQANPLERDVYMRIPKDIRKDGMIWKLKKPLYGLNDASRKFWLRMKDIFKDIGLVKLSGDEAVYYKHSDQGKLEGMISTHVDDFDLAGTMEFVEMVAKEIERVLDVSTVESDSFRFTGIDVKKTETGIEISMEDYAQSLEDINIREAKADEKLTREELKIYRKYVGKLNWLAANTRPDLAIYALDMAKKQKKAVIKDLREINRVLKKVRERESKVVFSRIGNKEELCVIGVSDASYHCSERSVAGEVILLRNLGSKKAAPIY